MRFKKFLRERKNENLIQKTQARYLLQQTDNLTNMWFKVMNIKGGERKEKQINSKFCEP